MLNIPDPPLCIFVSIKTSMFPTRKHPVSGTERSFPVTETRLRTRDADGITTAWHWNTEGGDTGEHPPVCSASLSPGMMAGVVGVEECDLTLTLMEETISASLEASGTGGRSFP